MRKLNFVTAIIFCLLVTTVTIGQNNEKASIKVKSINGAVPWTSLNLNNDPNNFQFAIVTDRTGGHRAGVFEDGVKKLNLLMPEFVMSVGDLIEGYTENELELDLQWKEFNGFVKELKMPFFYVPGNHDITNQVMEDKWKKLFGPTYYHFVYKDVLFLCLNSEDTKNGADAGTINDTQYEYIKKVLSENENVKWTLAFMHQPLWNQKDSKRWSDVEKLLANRKHTVFAGHVHNYVKYVRNNGKYFTLASTGGGSGLRGTSFGEFDHVAWITMTPDGPIVANLLLEGIWDENVNTEAMEKFTSTVNVNNLIKIEPILLEDLKIYEYTSKIKITNDKDVPMQMDLEFNLNMDLLPNFAKKSLVVAPNSVEFVDLKLKVSNNVNIDNLKELQLKTKASFTLENLPRFSFDRTINIKPEKLNKVHLIKEKITIDGNLNEWKNFPYQVNEPFNKSNPFLHEGKKDASFQFAINYDENFLYVAIKALDDSYNTNSNDWPLDQDAISIILDARPESISANSLGDWDETIYLLQNPNTDKQTDMFRASKMPKGTKAMTQKTKDGYQTEFAIPIQKIKEMQGTEDWKYFRLNVLMHDFDEDNQELILSWKPDWSGKENCIGSGFFQK